MARGWTCFGSTGTSAAAAARVVARAEDAALRGTDAEHGEEVGIDPLHLGPARLGAGPQVSFAGRVAGHPLEPFVHKDERLVGTRVGDGDALCGDVEGQWQPGRARIVLGQRELHLRTSAHDRVGTRKAVTSRDGGI